MTLTAYQQYINSVYVIKQKTQRVRWWSWFCNQGYWLVDKITDWLANRMCISEDIGFRNIFRIAALRDLAIQGQRQWLAPFDCAHAISYVVHYNYGLQVFRLTYLLT